MLIAEFADVVDAKREPAIRNGAIVPRPSAAFVARFVAIADDD